MKLLSKCLFYFCLMSFADLRAQIPTAFFSLTEQTVCAGTVIHVNDASSAVPLSWSYTLQGALTQTSSVQNPTFTVSNAGTYTLTLIAANGSGNSAPYTSTVLVNPLPLVSGGGATSVCAGSFLTLSGSGAATYVWSGGVIDGSAFVPVSNTIYTVTGSDLNGCSGSATVSVTVNNLPTISITGPTAVCVGNPLTLSVTGASTYTWSTLESNAVITDTPLLSTTYSVSGILAATGCSNSSVYAVVVNDLPDISVNSEALCAGSVFTMVPAGAITYTYSTGASTVIPLSNTSYTVSGTDINGCTSSAVAAVIVNPLPQITVNSGTICLGEMFMINPSGALSYTVLPGLSTLVSPTVTSNYSVTGVDVNGCLSGVSAISAVSVLSLPVVTVNSGSICAGSLFTITPAGAQSYTITGGTYTVSPASGTSYTLIGADASGCISSPVVSSLTVYPLPLVSVNSGSICAGEVFTITPTGAVTYTFVNGTATVAPLVNMSYSVQGTSPFGCVSPFAVAQVSVVNLPVIAVANGSICQGNSFVISPSGASSYSYAGGSATVSPSVSTSYSVIGFSTEGCLSSNSVVCTVSVEALPVISIAGPTAICSGDTATLSASGAISYTWNTNFSSATYTLHPLVTDTYSVSGIGVNGCEAGQSHTLMVNTLPQVSVSGGTICAGDTFTMSPTGALTYTFSGGSPLVSPTSTSTYSVSGTDANGCNSQSPAVITIVVNTISISVSGNTLICEGESTSLTAVGATSYSWSTTENSQTVVVSPLVSASYSVLAELNGCKDTAFVFLQVNPTPSVSISSSNVLICADEPLVLSASGAFTYTWSTQATGSSITLSPSVTSTYSVTGMSENNCEATAVYTQSVSACSGFNSMAEASDKIMLFPNPNSGSFYILLEESGSIEISNSTGRVILILVADAGQKEIRLTDQPAGLYVIRFTGSSKMCTGKVIITSNR